MVRVLSRRLETKGLFSLQNQQYSEKLSLTDTVPAGGSKLGKVSVSNLGHFMLQFMTGHYQTLEVITGVDLLPHTIDAGVNYLRGQLKDSSGNKALFNTYIPLDLFLSPGRIRSASAENNIIDQPFALRADQSPSLFYPFEFEYLFSSNTDILFDVKNDSSVALTYTIVFHGIRILSSTSVSGALQR